LCQHGHEVPSWARAHIGWMNTERLIIVIGAMLLIALVVVFAYVF
jgi:hypothetical protein